MPIKFQRDVTMMQDRGHVSDLDGLAERIRAANAVEPDFIAQIITEACPRLALLNTTHTSHIARLVEGSAWIDVALTLIEIELPNWRLRRLICDDGCWLCSLSQNLAMPIELDDTADACHPVAALAVIGALIEARRRGLTTREETTVLAFAAATGTLVCCDNFG
ncbi:hypothetical protein MXD81_05405 [Microbacteriaceae bacterium K1510]|nr:hypothetical protein [Microbacteriaceae bacterium K1510]